MDEIHHPPVLLDIFLDAALRLDEREGRFAIAFRRHDNLLDGNLLCVEKEFVTCSSRSISFFPLNRKRLNK